jgi:hypothetical protein
VGFVGAGGRVAGTLFFFSLTVASGAGAARDGVDHASRGHRHVDGLVKA